MNRKGKLILILAVPGLLIIVWIFVILRLLTPKLAVDIGEGPNIPNPPCTGDNCIDDPIFPTCTGDNCIITGTAKIISGDFTLHMPDFFYTDKSFGQFKKQLKKDYDITIKFVKYKDMNEFRDKLVEQLSNGLTGLDMMLVPIDWIEYLEEYVMKFEVESDSINTFHEVFYDYLTAEKYTFLPYGIDPFVTLVENESDTFENKIDMDAIKQSVLVGNSDKIFLIKMKVLMGVGSQDISRISKGKEPFDGYFLILYNIIYQAFMGNEPDLLETLMEFANEGPFQTRNFPKFYKTYKKFETINDDCLTFTKLCVLSYGYADISMGFLSDLDKIEKYFRKAKKEKSDFRIYNFMNNTEEYWVRGRGFLINKKTKNSKQISQFMEAYMSPDYNNVRQAMWPNLLSAFNELFDQKMSENEYELLNKYDSNFVILNPPKDLMQKLIEETRIIDVLKGKYSIKGFIQDPNWEF